MIRSMFMACSAGLLLAACGGSDGKEAKVDGQVSARLDGTTYTLPARCREHEGEFSVSSVDDGSGVEIAARQMGEKLNLDIFVGESDYSTPNLDQWERTSEGLEGSGRLWLDNADSYREYPVTVQASCG